MDNDSPNGSAAAQSHSSSSGATSNMASKANTWSDSALSASALRPSANIIRRQSSGPNSISDATEYSNFDFNSNDVLPKRRTLRAWDRIARSPHVTRNKSRNNGHRKKVWKRPDINTGANSAKIGQSGTDDTRRYGGEDDDNALVGIGEKRIALGEVSSNTPRAVKRLRLRDNVIPLFAQESMKDHDSMDILDYPPAKDLLKKPRFLTTMRDFETGFESPKRKPNKKFVARKEAGQILEASKHSPNKLSRSEDLNLQQVMVIADHDGQSRDETLSTGLSPTSGDGNNPDDVLERQLNDDAPEPSSREEDATLPQRDDSTDSEDQKRTTEALATPKRMPFADFTASRTPIASNSPPEQLLCKSDRTPQALSTVDVVDIAHDNSDSGATALSIPTDVPRENSAADMLDAGVLIHTSPVKFQSSRTPRTKRPIRGMTPNFKSSNDNGYVFDTPQIGTTLLRRESLRNKASPGKASAPQKSKSPEKKQGLKKRDTLQEREILQQFNENAGATSNPPTDQATMPVEDTVSIQPDLEQVKSTFANEEMAATLPATDHTEAELPLIEIAKEQNGNAPEDLSEPNENAHDEVETQSESIIQREPEDNDQLAHTMSDEDLPENSSPATDEVETGVEVTAQPIAESSEGNYSTRHTRATARLSDDTTVLKDFLHRAQVKKAAREVPNSSAPPTEFQAQMSPRRSPRKVQEHTADNESTVFPRKSASAVSLWPGTPPQKYSKSEIEDGDGEDATTEPTSYRRSTRSRLPAPSKTPVGPPSFIPLRRGDGTDPIILPKTPAQDLAVVTRTNTRRNKGQAKPPVQALQELPAESPQKQASVAEKQQRERAGKKVVSWAGKLACYQDSKSNVDEADEQQRPRMRRVRGLGTVNGTPAKKASSAAAVPSLPSNGTPAPKRRGKVV